VLPGDNFQSVTSNARLLDQILPLTLGKILCAGRSGQRGE
jgi:hypothetical protein